MTAKRLCTVTALGLLVAALVFACACSKEEVTESLGLISEDLLLEEAFTLMEDNRGSDTFVIIDLRSAEKYASGHIEEAINLDYNSPDFDQELDELDRDKAYLLYNHTDDVSGEVMDMMAVLGFAEVYNMLGGMKRWQRLGLPLVQ